jgi:hypothetical protein
MERPFPTFCHISDYGRDGFRNLHRMVAASSPLVVWAPSGLELDDRYERDECSLNSRQFLNLVNDGHIQVVGRRWWLTEPRERNAQPRQEAHWKEGFDDVLLAMYEEDTRLGAPQRARVRIMPPESGYDFADEQLGPINERIRNRRLYNRVLQLYRDNKVPVGTAEKATRKAAEITHRNTKKAERQKKRVLVREILRDARNHVDAVRMSEAHVPFWSIDDGQFIGLLDGNDERFRQEQAEVAPASHHYFTDYLKQSLELLREFERVASGQGTDLRNHKNLAGFLGSDGHAELIDWLKLHAERSRFLDLTDEQIRKSMLMHLREGIGRDVARRNLGNILQLPVQRYLRLIQALDMLTTVGAALASRTDIVNWVSFGLLLIVVVERTIIPEDYEGFRWPFFYAFGEKPNAATLKEMRQFIEALQTSEKTIHAVPGPCC